MEEAEDLCAYIPSEEVLSRFGLPRLQPRDIQTLNTKLINHSGKGGIIRLRHTNEELAIKDLKRVVAST